jgi:glycosyltransferase involved in cell wall biosynthesis
MSIPRFSLIMPTKNRPKYIREAIDAVLNQTYGNWELIIKDAGESVQDLIPVDPRIHYTHTPYYSFKEQVDSAFEDARGDILNFCADDDVLMTDALQRIHDNIDSAKWAYGKISRNDNCSWVGEKWNYNICKRVNQVPIPAAFWKREVIEQVGIPDVSTECYDWDYWLRLGSKWEPVFINEVLSFYRCHDEMGSVTRIESVRQAEGLIRNRAASGCYDANYELAI